MSKRDQFDECMGSENDLFTRPHVDTSTLNTSIIEIGPTVALSDDNSSFEHTYTGTQNEYVDLSETYLKLEVSLRKDKALLKRADEVGVVNNLMHSLFSNIKVHIKTVELETNPYYAYKAYISDLFNYGELEKKTWMVSQLFEKDTFDKMEELIRKDSSDNTKMITTNKGLLNRTNYFWIEGNEGVLRLRGKLHLDTFNVNRLLMNNVSFKITYEQQKDEFRLMSAIGGTFNLVIKKAILCVKKVQPSAYIMESHRRQILNTPAIYPYTKSKIYIESIKMGQTSESITVVKDDIIPKRMIIGFVKNTALTGQFDQNPFNFCGFNTSSMQAFVNGIPRPLISPIKSQLDSYMSLFDGLHPKHVHDLRMEEIPKGYAFVMYNFQKDCDFNNFETGTVKLDIEWSKALESAINIVCYLEFDSYYEIDSLGNLFKK